MIGLCLDDQKLVSGTEIFSNQIAIWGLFFWGGPGKTFKQCLKPGQSENNS